jgi:hypothetical protein
MTCIASLIDDGIIYVGGDSAGVSGMSMEVRADTKVFLNGPYIFGFTTSFRLGNLLQYKFDPPVKTDKKQSTTHFMVNDFIDGVRACLKKGGYATEEKGQESAGTFIVGFNGKLFIIYDDYQVAEPLDKIAAVGCGSQIALGSLYTSIGKPPQDRIMTSLAAAERFSAGVRSPFTLKKLAMPEV